MSDDGDWDALVVQWEDAMYEDACEARVRLLEEALREIQRLDGERAADIATKALAGEDWGR